MVVYHEDNLPPQKWLIGRVEEVDVGSDDKVLVAAVCTANGVFKRPIHKLAPLPIDIAGLKVLQSGRCYVSTLAK